MKILGVAVCTSVALVCLSDFKYQSPVVIMDVEQCLIQNCEAGLTTS